MTTLGSYITLGRSGLRVSPLTLGTMTFGEDWGWGASPETSEAILAEYLDRGGNVVDTANVYTNGHSEKIIGDFFAARPGLREHIVLSTKFFGNLHPGDPNGGGSSRKALIAQLDESLRRLQTDYVDLYWLHNWDRHAPIDETLRALDDLVIAGKIRYVGLSDVPAWVAAQAQTIDQFRGWAPVTALQLEYSLLDRTSEGELLPMAEALGIGVLPWSPLRGGQLSGKYIRNNDPPADSRSGRYVEPTERDWDVIEAVARLAAELGVSSAEVALAWVRSRPRSLPRSSERAPLNSCGPISPHSRSPSLRSNSLLLTSHRRHPSTSPPPSTPRSPQYSGSAARPSMVSSSRCGRSCSPAQPATEFTPAARTAARPFAAGRRAEPKASPSRTSSKTPQDPLEKLDRPRSSGWVPEARTMLPPDSRVVPPSVALTRCFSIFSISAFLDT
jgi:aryl-alcohol dehydrogenase-like predicted oxidoreductase